MNSPSRLSTLQYKVHGGIIAVVDSCVWIEHFYRNACALRASGFDEALELTGDELQSLRVIGDTETTLLIGSWLIAAALVSSRQTTDRAFEWAVRLFAREQERSSSLLRRLIAHRPLDRAGDKRGTSTRLAVSGESVVRGSLIEMRGQQPRSPARAAALWRAVLRALPPELLWLLLSCRSAVAGSFLASVGQGEETSADFKGLTALLAAEHGVREQFALFAVRQLSNWPALPLALMRRIAVLLIAARVWIRRQRALRSAGQTFGGFLATLLERSA